MNLQFNIIKILIMLVCGILLIGCSRDGLNDNTKLIIGTNAEYAPYTYIEKGTIVGFDIDLIKELAKVLHKKVVVKDMPFDALIVALQQHQVAIIAAGLTPTAARAQQVLFTTPYLKGDPLVIVTLRETGELVEGLKEITQPIIVNEGYTADLYMSKLNNKNLIRLNTPADAFLALLAKRCYAFVTAQSTFTNFAKHNIQAKLMQIKMIENSDETYALAVAKNNQNFYKQLEEALKQLDKNGVLQQLKKKWKL
jgi:polar amino acid transport system substrate-binding protein